VQGNLTRRRRSSPAWRSRRLLSFGLRAFVFVSPFAVSLGVVALLALAIARPRPLGLLLLWWALILAGGLLSLLATMRAGRQLLPLAALFRLSLLFPHHAPSRLRIARLSARPQLLKRRLQELGTAPGRADALAAQRVFELAVAMSLGERARWGRSERVQRLTGLIARELHLAEADRALLGWACLLSDLARPLLPAEILSRSGGPTPRDWATLSRPSPKGAALVALCLPFLGDWGRAIGEQKERFDGSGYPQGLLGSQISLGSRIVAVALALEGLTAPRPLFRPLPLARAQSELARRSKAQLDPLLVEALRRVPGAELRGVVFPAPLSQLPLVALGQAALTPLGRYRGGRWAQSCLAGAALSLLVLGVSHPAPAAAHQAAGRGYSKPARSPSPLSPQLQTPFPSGAAGTATPSPSSSPSALPASALPPAATPGPYLPPPADSPSPSAIAPSPTPLPTAEPTLTPEPSGSPSATPSPSPTP
jgi:hypothetical protein